MSMSVRTGVVIRMPSIIGSIGTVESLRTVDRHRIGPDVPLSGNRELDLARSDAFELPEHGGGGV